MIRDEAIRIRVGSGSAAPNSSKMSAKTGRAKTFRITMAMAMPPITTMG